MSKYYILEVNYRMKGDTAASRTLLSEPRLFPSKPTQKDLEREALFLIHARGHEEVELLAVTAREANE
jgi:hypothetical protein